MDASRLEKLGLRMEEGSSSPLARLELPEGFVLDNPVTRKPLPPVTFQISDEVLIPIAPPAVAGLPPVPLNSVKTRTALALALTSAFDEFLFHLERRSSQLQALGLHPTVNPATLELSSELEAGALSFVLAMDRQGQFRVAQASRQGSELSGLPEFRFELSEFRDGESLASYLAAHIEEQPSRPHASSPPSPGLVRYEELAQAFGAQAVVPPRSALEILVQLSVKGATYRFAAARVQGRTFRGLLAGAKGKVWAERFELDSFPGIVHLVADLLKVAPEDVQLLGPESPQE
ncbi:hypothetical protein [Hyalangium versicolor]|uniref:hypothetical protein n=1 Tax=Hyalangium versicolor TaxID=2861190 RepID=UPI001CCAEACD|nr:hypothetical protein [Hyalangium versicolor]